ncbi:histidine kinase [uncultured Dokdonia sp.]|uniref:sensor histidine kinase n=1 Tax=uncultured Dokdonia sp. TaxID=575653 RepID=UPI002601635B|nr:histidine kinase [uncultured Dokdonia sp.]
MTKRLESIISQIMKYKGHHIALWALYHFVWWSVYEGSIIRVFTTLLEPQNIIKYLGYVIFQALGVYFCLYVLIPKFLEKRRYIYFFGSLIATLIGTALFITCNYYISGAIVGISPYELFKITPASPITIFKNNAFPSCVAAMTLGMSIKLAKNWLLSQKQQQLLEKEKLETELKFLKSQFNPHFLFNTINSIFVLINKNTEMASESLVKFSSLLRYQLYECNTPTIQLSNEIQYIKSFIELESLRQNDNFSLEESYPETVPTDLMIAPFILIPFIENAFKHLAEDHQLKKWIQFDLRIEDGVLTFFIANSANFQIQTHTLEDASYKGLGLKNVKRRLDLVYPDTYTLIVTENKDRYTVQLSLVLSKQVHVQLQKVTA